MCPEFDFYFALNLHPGIQWNVLTPKIENQIISKSLLLVIYCGFDVLAIKEYIIIIGKMYPI